MTNSYLVIILLGVFVGCTLPEKKPQVSFGKLERLASVPSKYVTPRHIDIWLPEDYSTDQIYPVIYMHDGPNAL